jgi:hypothetical protein
VRYLSFKAFRSFLGPTQAPVQWVPGVKRSGREGNHLNPRGMNVTSYTLIKCVLMRTAKMLAVMAESEFRPQAGGKCYRLKCNCVENQRFAVTETSIFERTGMFTRLVRRRDPDPR